MHTRTACLAWFVLPRQIVAWIFPRFLGLVCLLSLPRAFSPSVRAAETLATAQGDVVINPIQHASMVLQWNGITIYIDPVGGGAKYAAFPRADLVLITHEHGDHFDIPTLEAILKTQTVVVTSTTVGQKLPTSIGKQAHILGNGQSFKSAGGTIDAIPAYNLTAEKLKYHPKGVGNGYLLTLGGKRLYISGDTEDIPEMKALTNIDVAFVCMNLPYTMTIDQAVGAVRAFKPKVVYPYHSRGSDVARFKQEVEQDSAISARILKWYP
jgi:L-ascorbate metabolism protein UlaG (beta-lactamase superfamily)